jgi:hypothetical protein
MAININPEHEGKLHARMGVSRGKKIKIGDLMAEEHKAKRTGDTTLEREAVFAINARKWNKGKAA